MAQPETLLEGKYEILDKMREGGMGTIYRVRHRLLDQVRVIKVMRAHVIADEDLRRRFVDEARTTTRLNHPNICTIHDFALDADGTGYLVMEYIDGVNLSELLAVSGLPGLPLSLEIAHQSLLALGYLHRKGIVHRDIAPDNLMLTRDDKGRPLVKLIDLGIAKAADRITEKTATGVFLGKLKYASPEQFGNLPSGERLDGRSDIYGLGVVLYEILTGVRPVTGETPGELLRAHLFAPPTPFAETDPTGKVPAELRRAILKALEKKREDRYATAEDFDRDVVAIQERYLGPEDLDGTLAVLAAIPKLERFSRDHHVTPSAQDRLDRQFAPHTTPPPSLSQTVMPTVVPAGASERRPRLPTVTTAEAVRPPRSRLGAVAVVAGVVVLGALVAYLVARSRSPRPAEQAAGIPLAPVATAPLPSPAPPTAPPAASQAAAEPTAVATTPEAVAAAAEEPAAAPPTRAPRRVPTARPTPRESRPPRSSFPEPPAVAQVFPSVPTPGAPPVRPSPAPTRVAVAAQAEKEAAAVPLPPSPRPPVTDQDRIRDTVRAYERAQSTLDAALYARIFPSVDRDRLEHAFRNFASQSVEFEVRRIELDPGGTRATVYGYEKRVAVPRAGTEQRMNADRVIRLEKNGDAWVIRQVN